MIVVVAGPTCSGKSSLAIKLAQALDAEIINGDAFQVYKYFDIGTAKPTLKERALVPHHLFDFVDPNTNFNVKDYQEIARKTISYLEDKKKNIIIVGGTGLYQKATLYDFSFDDENNHADMSDLALLSNEELYEELKRIDEESTKTIHVNNRKRVLRAIEIYRLHGKTKSSIIDSQRHKLLYDVMFIGLNVEREKLYNDINNRVDEMIKDGLVEEVTNLKNKYPESIHAFQAIGYKELLAYLDHKLTLNEPLELINKNSRNYAKRQMTYFKNQLPMNWFDNADKAYNYVIKNMKGD